MNEEDEEAEGSRRSQPTKQIKISIQLSFHDIVFWTRHCCQKLGLFTEVEFLSEPKPGLIYSPQSKFRDQDQRI